MRLLRSTLFNFWFYGLTIVLGTVSLVWPFRTWQRSLQFARLWARLVLGGLRVLCGVRWRVTGREHLPKSGPALIASMHQSAFDTLVWALLAPEFSYVLKVELTRVPLFGQMLVQAGMIAVDRAAGMAALRGLLRDAGQAMADGRQIIIFPEGTRVPPGETVPLQAGVAAIAGKTGLPVIPVATDSGVFWARRAFRKTPGTITVAIQPPLATGMSRPNLMAALEQAFREGAARLGQPVDQPPRILAGGPSRWT